MTQGANDNGLDFRKLLTAYPALPKHDLFAAGRHRSGRLASHPDLRQRFGTLLTTRSAPALSPVASPPIPVARAKIWKPCFRTSSASPTRLAWATASPATIPTAHVDDLARFVTYHDGSHRSAKTSRRRRSISTPCQGQSRHAYGHERSGRYARCASRRCPMPIPVPSTRPAVFPATLSPISTSQKTVLVPTSTTPIRTASRSTRGASLSRLYIRLPKIVGPLPAATMVLGLGTTLTA